MGGFQRRAFHFLGHARRVGAVPGLVNSPPDFRMGGKFSRHAHLRVILACFDFRIVEGRDAFRVSVPPGESHINPIQTMKTTIILTLTAALATLATAADLQHCTRFLSAPEAVRKTVLSEARDGLIDELEIHRIEGRAIYVAEVERPADLKIYVDESGRLIRVREEIDVRQLPQPVQAAIDAENGKIDDLEKETADGKVTYHAEIETPGDVEVRLKISADGKVLSRHERHDD
jgi:uncharacterized membrane protein YkoI